MRGSSTHIGSLRLKSWAMIHEASAWIVSERLRQLNALLVKYRADQARVPAGSAEGGQWVSEGGSGSTTSSSTRQPGKQPFDIDKAVDVLRERVGPKSRGYCARYVRIAVNAGGLVLKKYPVSAREYDPYLETQGFSKISPTPLPTYTPTKGDIAVFQPYPGGRPEGHIAMYDGNHWMSDYRQQGFWPGSGYERYKPPYAIFRYTRN